MGIAIIVPNVSFAGNNIGKVTLSSDGGGSEGGGGGSDVIDVTAITINGPSTVNTKSNTATYSVAYTPSNTTQKGVKWSIESGSDYASIAQNNGTLTVKKTGSVTIKATSTHNPSITATKTISVTYVTQTPVLPAEEELEYIGTANGNYIDTNATMYASSKILAKAKFEKVESPTNNMRIFLLHDGGNYLIGNLYNTNQFATVTPGHKLTVANPLSGLVELEVSMYTHDITVDGQKITEFSANSSFQNVDGGNICLFASPAVLTKNLKRVDIYYFKQEVNKELKLDLIPVLKDGKPCFHDRISDKYLNFTTNGNGKIYYAKKSDPNNELTYNG